MAHYQYLIIGGGMAADAAAQGIRERDARGTIGLISAEHDPPYNRPPLTKGLWKDKPLAAIWRHTPERHVDLHLGHRVETVDVPHKQVTDDHGQSYTYDKLLLATGGQPRRLPFGGDLIIYYRTLEDFRRLYATAEQRRKFAVIGGGFIGSEIAAALAMNEKEVTMFFPDSAICERMFPRDLAGFLNDFYRQKGVELRAGESVTGLEQRGEQLALFTSGKHVVTVDCVVAGIGIEPAVELAKQARLDVENGILVNEFCGTRQPDIYAAGDVAIFFNPALGKYTRVEHEDNALTMGRVAGRNMAGDAQPYHHLPYFYSDLFELGYELDARLQMVVDWQEPYQKGVIYYLKQNRVRGVLLWNVWNQVEAARVLIAARQEFQPRDLMGRLPAAKVRVGAGQE
ncbi:MAG: NAD(P)/FAD-dependent oxidoreductase [Planctomycetes bacterium]|nr:NAD(P)/FAD-dependent oxidoreductase [Planctomycetota bacterium]